jgi:hypothetical protein
VERGDQQAAEENRENKRARVCDHQLSVHMHREKHEPPRSDKVSCGYSDPHDPQDSDRGMAFGAGDDVDPEARADDDDERYPSSCYEGNFENPAGHKAQPLSIAAGGHSQHRQDRPGQQPRDSVQNFDNPKRDCVIAGLWARIKQRHRDQGHLEVDGAERGGNRVDRGLVKQLPPAGWM